MRNAFICYHVSPIDHYWKQMRGLPETLMLLAEDAFDEDAFQDVDILFRFMEDWAEAADLAKKYWWEGDFTEPPRVFWLPNPDSAQFEYGFVFKQRNNGSTFVVSPFKLAHLEDCCLIQEKRPLP